MKNILQLFLFFVFIIICLLACKKNELEIENLNGNQIDVLGHGGMGVKSTYPMNSAESVLKCLAIGADGCELDIQMTKDNVLIAFHDDELSKKTHLQGIVNELNWSEIQGASYARTPYLDYTIVSLEQLFSKIKDFQNYTFTLDCKLYTNQSDKSLFYADYVTALLDIIEKYQIGNTVNIESQDTTF